jgi:hypothetical protein
MNNAGFNSAWQGPSALAGDEDVLPSMFRYEAQELLSRREKHERDRMRFRGLRPPFRIVSPIYLPQRNAAIAIAARTIKSSVLPR